MPFVRAKTVLLTCTLLASLSARPARAAAVDKLDRLELAIWPEFDRPATLVILTAMLPKDTTFPATVSIPVPAAVGQPHAVAARGADGVLRLMSNTRRVVGAWAFIDVEATFAEVRVEYYAPLDTSKPQRSFTIGLPSGLEIGEVAYELQQPKGAQELTVAPGTITRRQGKDGLTYHRAVVGPLKKEAPLTIKIGYKKNTNTLTRSQTVHPPAAQQASPPAPVAAQPQAAPATPSRRRSGSYPWVVIIVAGLVGGAMGFLTSKSSKKDKNKKKKG